MTEEQASELLTIVSEMQVVGHQTHDLVGSIYLAALVMLVLVGALLAVELSRG